MTFLLVHAVKSILYCLRQRYSISTWSLVESVKKAVVHCASGGNIFKPICKYSLLSNILTKLSRVALNLVHTRQASEACVVMPLLI